MKCTMFSRNNKNTIVSTKHGVFFVLEKIICKIEKKETKVKI